VTGDAAALIQRNATAAIVNISRIIATVHIILSLRCGDPSPTAVLDVACTFQVTRIKVECCQDERFIQAHRVNSTNFLVELKRRNVYRAAVAYGVVAWFLTQLTTQVFPFFEIPNSAVRFVVIALVVGFPIAMLLSWLYEFTPEGIVRTEDLDPVHARSVQRATGRILDFIIIGVLLLVIAMMIVGRLPFYRQTGESISQKSVAVLPFENLSPDPDNAYFAEGIQDEILTRLAKIADLRVISRTSTSRYQGKARNLAEIAKQLGVANILEGSVQKAADQVRVNVQLVNAQTDSHLWAETYDRKLTDIFGVESEIAKGIAESLQAKLTGHEEQVIAAKPTDNVEAYNAYLRGLAYSLKPLSNTPANALGAQQYLREAVRLDPKFAVAWALLSYVDARGYLTTNLQPTVALREEARQAADTALSLQPNLGQAVLAKGFYHYACLKDYNTAARYFEQARQFLPNSSRIPELLAYVTRRRGEWDQSESYFNEAERLDPQNGQLLTQHALSYMRFRRFAEAQRRLDLVLNITPDDDHTLAFKASIAQAQSDLPRAAALLAPLHPNADDTVVLEAQVYQAILERRPAQIIPRLKEILDKPDPALGYFNGDLRFWLGWAQEVAGDHAAAQKSWQQARAELESFLKEQPENFNLLGALVLTNMDLGDKAAALALAERAIAANPIEKDAVTGPAPIQVLAAVAAQMGEPDRAIAALRKLLSIPVLTDTAAPLTPALLRLDPMFDPLRNDPRFQELVALSPPK
jgi:TolB-like protein/Tfp pilus assembly protein PilF